MDLSKLSDAELQILLKQNQPKPPEPPPPPAEPPRTLTDRAVGAVKAVDAGAGAGIAGLVGFPRFAGEMVEKGLYGAVDAGRELLGQPPYERPEKSFLEHWPSTEGAQQEIQKTYYDGKPAYEPKDILERYLKTIGEFAVVPTPVGAGRTALARTAQRIGSVVAPAVASETAGEAAKYLADDEYGKYAEPVARFLGAVVGGGVHGYLTKPRTAQQVLERSMPGVTPQMVAQAEELMQRSHSGPRAVPLTWSEALSQVAGRPILTDMTRHLEASTDSAPRMAEFFGQRPQQVERAVDSATEALSPGTVNPNMVGPRAAAAAGQTIQDIRNSINTATRPLYDAAGQHLVPQQVHAAMMADPLFAQTVNTIRNDPARNALVRAASDRSISMYDAVAKELEQRAVNAAQPLNPQASQTIAGVTGQAGGDVKNLAITAERAATQGPSAYEAALARQAQMRADQLDPALQGPTGRVAESTTTPGATAALFPTGKQAVAGGHVQIGQTVRDLARHDPRAASDLVRQHAETLFNEAASDLVSGPAQTGGAKFRQQLIGNRQEARNFQAAVENATPDGAQRWQGFSRLLDILEATGTRLNVGSRTSYNDEIRQAMKSKGMPIPARVASDPLSFFKPLNDKLESWRYGKNLNELASIVTDPRAAPLLRQIAESNVNSWKGARKALTLINYINATNTRQNEDTTTLPAIEVTSPK